MAKTLFQNGTVVVSNFMNAIFGQGASGGHKHDGIDQDGSCGKIDLTAHVENELPVANMEKQDIDSGTTGTLPASRVTGLETSSFLGEIRAFYGLTPPDATWLVCDGGTIPAGSEYDDIRALLSSTETPDFKGKSLFGYDSGNQKFDALGSETQSNYVGEEDHALTSAENGPHSHTYATTNTGGSTSNRSAQGSPTADSNPSTSTSGSGTPHNNLPPYGVVNFIIKAIA